MKCEAGHTEYNPLCVECDRQLQVAEQNQEENTEYFIVPPIAACGDGMTRFVIDVYEYVCMSNEFIEVLNKHTGLKWEHLGTFMDQACFATRGEVNEQFKVPYPRRNK